MSGPQGGWLRGIVKEVPSGDTVVVMAAAKSGIPPEKRITLSSLLAPRLVSTCVLLDHRNWRVPVRDFARLVETRFVQRGPVVLRIQPLIWYRIIYTC